jgi:thymidylate kinase
MMNAKQTSVQFWIDAISIGHTEERAFYYLCNDDQSIRWIWPSDNKKPVFLKLYTASSVKSKIFVVLVRLIFLLKLQGLFAEKAIASLDFFPLEYNIDSTREWAMFTGTKGPNRKLVIVAYDLQNICSFTKIAYGTNATALIQNEKKATDKLTGYNLLNTTIPQLISHSENHIQISDVSNGKRSSKLEHSHINSLIEIEQQTKNETVLSHTPFFKVAMDNYREINTNLDQRVPNAMKRKLQWLISSIDEKSKIETVTAHGDFTPWNCFVAQNQLSLYDLEMVQEKMPLGYDAFHFIIQNGVLVKRASWKSISQEIMDVICPALFGGDKKKTKEYLKLYLLINTTYYLDIYSKQDEWHAQVDWLLQTWNEAISYVLQYSHDSRKLVLMDTFDFMQNKKYAALKFKGYLPEQVSSLSDVDFCTSKKDATALIKFIKNHCLVNVARIKNLSFMKNIELVLNNSELLSIDCIWQLKRKNLVLQNIHQLINSSSSNVFGIKQPSCLVEADYVNHFYALNKAETPIHYKSRSFELKMQNLAESTKPLAIQKALKKTLKKKRINKGLSLINNTIHYGIDTLKSSIGPRGFIVTFSGVDGAGKSTLIEITKQRIDKQLRKSVVVLRHRPSVLPIISAWTLGKAAAEQKAASTLPRQGKNSSTLSSIVRFTYYYTDYVLGQFYVYAKYVLRGKVVVYDRYYFDFINDSKRSNINLPKWVTTLGYKLIMKPDVNFFLYADAETILARKQELDAVTIEELTDKYLTLFQKLNTTEKTKKYHAVKNLKLQDTVDSIMTQLKLQVA